MIQAGPGVELMGMELERTRDALNHPVRRQILRTLINSGRPMAAAEIVAAGLPNASLSTVAYHALVLEGTGGVSHTPGPAPPRYTTDLSTNTEIVALLEATRRADESGG